MKKTLFLLVSLLLNSNFSIYLDAIPASHNMMNMDQDKTSKGFKAWIKANPKKFALLVAAAIASIIGGGVVVHKVIAKHWLWEAKPKTSELTPEEQKQKEEAIKLEKAREEYSKFNPKDIKNRIFSIRTEEMLDRKAAEFIEKLTGTIVPLNSRPRAELNKMLDEAKSNNDLDLLNKIKEFKNYIKAHEAEWFEIEANKINPKELTHEDVKLLDQVKNDAMESLLGYTKPLDVNASEGKKKFRLHRINDFLNGINKAISGDEEAIKRANLIFPFIDLNEVKKTLEEALKTSTKTH